MPRILLQPQLTPTPVANRIGVYAKTINSIDKLIYQTADGVEHIIPTGGFSWISASATATATSNTGYFLNSSGGAFTMTLPASPTVGDEIKFIDSTGTCGTNNVTIAGNGKTIGRSSEDLLLDYADAFVALVYCSTGWLIMN